MVPTLLNSILRPIHGEGEVSETMAHPVMECKLIVELLTHNCLPMWL